LDQVTATKGEMTMRITNPTALATVARGGRRRRPQESPQGSPRTLRQRMNAYTKWAFNAQRELSSRYDRAA
jgi:hypothetical protein